MKARAQRAARLAVLAGARTGFPRVDLATLFSRRAREFPDRIAVRYADAILTYAELDDRTSRIAGSLAARGVRPGSVVAVEGEPSSRLIATILGVIKAGATYLPIDPANPPGRTAAILKDAGAALLIDAEVAPGDRHTVPAIDPESAAYIMYTSSSTGRPKGIAVPHRAIARLVLETNYVEIGPDDVIAQAANVCCDASTFEIWGALLNGAELAGIDERTLLDTAALRRTLSDRGATTMLLTTALLHQHADADPSAFESLRTLLFGGERCDPSRVARVLDARGPERLVHVYGSAETTAFATWYPVESVRGETVPIGGPIANTDVYLLDERMQPVEQGRIGEIWIGGDGIALGYLGDPELTASRFVEDPGYGRIYRTGDLAYLDHTGAIELVGRSPVGG